MLVKAMLPELEAVILVSLIMLGATNVGTAELPPDVRTNPDVAKPVEADCNAPVVVVPPTIGAYAVNEVSPVPPPDTVRFVHEGDNPAPLVVNTWPEVHAANEPI